MVTMCSLVMAGSESRPSLPQRALRLHGGLHHAELLAQLAASLAARQPAHHLHHLLHLEKLLDETIDFLDRPAAATRDALAAAAVEELVIAALPGRHRQDDGLDV